MFPTSAILCTLDSGHYAHCTLCTLHTHARARVEGEAKEVFRDCLSKAKLLQRLGILCNAV